MSVLGKLGFIHRQLWRQDGLYRFALLIGPATLLGGMLATAAWLSAQAIKGTGQQPPWAAPSGKNLYWDTGEIHAVKPIAQLPPNGPDGALAGFATGWRARTSPIQISPALDVNIESTPLTAFFLDGPTIEMTRLLEEGPKDTLFVGAAQAFLAVRTPGVYAIAARLERAAGPPATCLSRLGFGEHRIISSITPNLFDDLSRTFDPVQFDLQSGLYPIAWAFGCWHAGKMTGPGRLTLLVQHPGEPTLQAARPDEIVRQERVRP